MASVPAQTFTDEIVRLVASFGSLERIAAYKLPQNIDERFHYLLEQNSEGIITAAEREELTAFLTLNRLLKKLKLEAALQLEGVDDTD